MKSVSIPEAFYHYLWKYKAVRPGLITISGEALEIIDPGWHNTDSGPDFLMARLRIANTIWAGNVEIHVRSSDWYKHGHHKDKAYQNVILHAVAVNDRPVIDHTGKEIQTLCFEHNYDQDILSRYELISKNLLWIPCMHLIKEVRNIIVINTIHSKAIERLQKKSLEVQTELAACNGDWEECCYRLICKQFGSKVNTDAFEMLARTIPSKILMKHHRDLFQLEALLFGQSGLLNMHLREKYPLQLKKEYSFLAVKYKLQPMPGYIWKFMRLRPAAFPSLRIAQLAVLYHRQQLVFREILEQESLDGLNAIFKLEASVYWNRHYVFNKKSASKIKRFGLQATRILLINAILPLVYHYGVTMNMPALCDRALQFLETIPAESNAVIRRWRELGISVNNSLESQGLLQLKVTLCDQKACLDCPIGHALIK